MEYDEDNPIPNTNGRVIGIDLGLADFAITYDGDKTVLYANPKHLYKYQRKLAVKQRIAARKKKGVVVKIRLIKLQLGYTNKSAMSAQTIYTSCLER